MNRVLSFAIFIFLVLPVNAQETTFVWRGVARTKPQFVESYKISVYFEAESIAFIDNTVKRVAASNLFDNQEQFHRYRWYHIMILDSHSVVIRPSNHILPYETIQRVRGYTAIDGRLAMIFIPPHIDTINVKDLPEVMLHTNRRKGFIYEETGFIIDSSQMIPGFVGIDDDISSIIVHYTNGTWTQKMERKGVVESNTSNSWFPPSLSICCVPFITYQYEVTDSRFYSRIISSLSSVIGKRSYSNRLFMTMDNTKKGSIALSFYESPPESIGRISGCFFVGDCTVYFYDEAPSFLLKRIDDSIYPIFVNRGDIRIAYHGLSSAVPILLIEYNYPAIKWHKMGTVDDVLL